jgi:hypothetical protein
MTVTDKLPLELLVDASGHLSEEGATVLADGQDDLCPLRVLEHAEACPTCQLRIGEAALLSASVSEAMSATAPSRGLATAAQEASSGATRTRSSMRVPRQLPLVALAAAFAVALLGALPALLRLPHAVVGFTSTCECVVPALLRSLTRVLRAPHATLGPIATVAPIAAALVLTMAGLLVARELPRARTAERGA